MLLHSLRALTAHLGSTLSNDTACRCFLLCHKAPCTSTCTSTDQISGVVISCQRDLCRVDFPAPAPAPSGGDWTIRTLKQGDGERAPHYWDSAQGADLAAEAPNLDWGVPQSTPLGASPAAMPAGGTPRLVPHYWDATEPVATAVPSPVPKDVPQGSNLQIYEHRWRMPNQAVGRVPADGTFPAQVQHHSSDGSQCSFALKA